MTIRKHFEDFFPEFLDENYTCFSDYLEDQGFTETEVEDISKKYPKYFDDSKYSYYLSEKEIINQLDNDYSFMTII